jgi:hypothetical protein
LHHEDLGIVADISDVHDASIFRVKVSRVVKCERFDGGNLFLQNGYMVHIHTGKLPKTESTTMNHSEPFISYSDGGSYLLEKSSAKPLCK